jgi:cysteine desulfurase
VIYLDHNATTALDPDVLEHMLPYLRDAYGNASSIHRAGQRTRQAVDDAREQLARALGCSAKALVLTSGGTEADNLALRGVFAARKATHRRIVTTSVEHPAVLDTARALAAEGAEVTELTVDADGQLNWDDVEQAIQPDTALVSVMWANNETGVLFPVEQIGALCRERGVPFHVDAVQSLGKLAIDLAALPIDLLTISAHKICGPKGIGALFVRKGTPLWTVQTGGHQERGRRGGTENVAAIVGFGQAMKLASDRLERDRAHLELLRDDLAAALMACVPNVRVTGERSPRLANTLNVCFRDVEGEALLMALDLAGICASSGSACTAGSLEPSHVVKAMGLPPEWARGAVRFSLGRCNTREELDEVVRVVTHSVQKLRSMS